MPILTKKKLSELVGGDMNSSGGDRITTNNSEIETGPIQKSYNDDSYYEKGQSTTSDVTAKQYRQNIPWFAVYSWGTTKSSVGSNTNENVIKKKNVEETINNLVKKIKDLDIIDKNKNEMFDSLVKSLKDTKLTETELDSLLELLQNKKDSLIKNNI